ncbi:unnamed protein product [Prorocentrum cordatum]|uniref:Methyltransferase FkbM domain-containing protein n=1 Tax=Prorocentrum cordatum TaxID=2364126 RepID=A0ABN9PUU0_9DINO|nr:unnamed protein product [Polarella glacialis]
MSEVARLPRRSEGNESVNLTTLDAILGAFPATMRALVGAKIDVEGHEFPVLKGARRLLREAPPCWLQLENSALNHVELMHKILREFGYESSGKILSAGKDDYMYVQHDPEACMKQRVAAA